MPTRFRLAAALLTLALIPASGTTALAATTRATPPTPPPTAAPTGLARPDLARPDLVRPDLTRAAATPTLTGAHPCPDLDAFTCSTLTVPLDHSGRTPGTLDLQVAVADNADARKGVLLGLTGGPGQDGLSHVAAFQKALAPVLDDYRLVILDQRGTGGGALQCPQLQDERGIVDYDVPSREAVLACAAAIGPNRRYFTTTDTVADLDLLRRALGADRWTLDGVSYGTYVAERYAMAHPRRVSRMVLDSVVPHVSFDGLSTDMMHAFGRVLDEACKAAACTTDPVDDLAAVVRQQHNGPVLLDTLSVLGIVDPDYEGVPQLLAAARAGNTGQLNGLIAGVHQGTRGPATDQSQGLEASTLCAEMRWPWDSSATPEIARGPLLDAAVRRLSTRDVWPFDKATAAGNGLIVLCRNWPRTPVSPVPRDRELPAVPALLLVGTRDLSTPMEWAKWEVAHAPKGELVVVPGAGHSLQTRAQGEQGRVAAIDFLDRD
ncbi:MAG TPA: alpha/beta fold hydrolase [Actinopolymorphaceae bacterium]|nr:alpha/beta fold hydrolase [Actinopolymorphaceae bacterium]